MSFHYLLEIEMDPIHPKNMYVQVNNLKKAAKLFSGIRILSRVSRDYKRNRALEKNQSTSNNDEITDRFV